MEHNRDCIEKSCETLSRLFKHQHVSCISKVLYNFNTISIFVGHFALAFKGRCSTRIVAILIQTFNTNISLVVCNTVDGKSSRISTSVLFGTVVVELTIIERLNVGLFQNASPNILRTFRGLYMRRFSLHHTIDNWLRRCRMYSLYLVPLLSETQWRAMETIQNNAH